MTKEEQYLKTFDLDEEFKEFCKRYDLFDNSDRLEELKEKMLDLAMSTFFMDRIHNDYKEMYEKYNREYKKTEKENSEMKAFIVYLKKHIFDINSETLNGNFKLFTIKCKGSHCYMLLEPNNRVEEILDNERL